MYDICVESVAGTLVYEREEVIVGNGNVLRGDTTMNNMVNLIFFKVYDDQVGLDKAANVRTGRRGR